MKQGLFKKPLYSIAQMVFTYQNEKIPYPICRVEFRPWIDFNTQHPNDNYAYKLQFPNGQSKWINEESIYLSPIDPKTDNCSHPDYAISYIGGAEMCNKCGKTWG